MIMTDNVFDMLIGPQDVMHTSAKRARDLRLSQNITQKELAERVGVAEGTIKRFEHTGEVQFRTLLGIALVLGRLDDFAEVFKKSDVPKSLYHPEPEPKRPRQRARQKKTLY